MINFNADISLVSFVICSLNALIIDGSSAFSNVVSYVVDVYTTGIILSSSLIKFVLFFKLMLDVFTTLTFNPFDDDLFDDNDIKLLI